MVLIDGIVFTNNRQKGIQRYFYEMLSRAANVVETAVFLDEPQGAPLPGACETIVRSEQFWTSRAQMHRWGWRRFRRSFLPTKLPQASVFHTSYFTRSPVPALPEVTTVYDMIFERLPYYYGVGSHEDALQKAESIRAAARIIAISQSTADELIAFYPDVRDRVVTIYPGAEHLPRVAAAETEHRPQSTYCLFVGYRFAYKNFTTVLDAMTLAGWPKDRELHVVGTPFLLTELMLIKRLGLEGRVRHCGQLPDAELAREYANCAAFVFPSLGEGFGLPILEAQACGAPLACSNIPVFREIAGGAANFFDPLDPADLLAAINACEHSRGDDSLAAARRANLSRFSWERCAEQTIEVWNSARQ